MHPYARTNEINIIFKIHRNTTGSLKMSGSEARSFCIEEAPENKIRPYVPPYPDSENLQIWRRAIIKLTVLPTECGISLIKSTLYCGSERSGARRLDGAAVASFWSTECSTRYVPRLSSCSEVMLKPFQI